MDRRPRRRRDPDVGRIASGEAIDADGDGRPDDCLPPTPGLDDDGTVGFGDLLAVLSAWTG